MNDNNIRAFPSFERLQFLRSTAVSDAHKETVYTEFSGMTLRDYFAAKAMQSIVLAALTNAEVAGCIRESIDPHAWVAGLSYEHADAMLKARES